MTKAIRTGGSLIIPVQSARDGCPDCKSIYLDRVKRSMADRMVSLVVSVKRYHCASCDWEGVLKVSSKK